MKIVFLLMAVLLPSTLLAEDHSTRTKVGVSTEAVFSEPYKRASISVDMSNWVLTPGYITSEDRRFGFALVGYRFKREMEHGGELFAEPHFGFAQGSSLGTSGLFGGRVELESRKWIVASWIDTYRGGKVHFTTCEPLAEASRHIGGGFFLGVTSSCYIGPGNETGEEKSPHHEVSAHAATTEHLFFAGPTASYRRGKVLVGASYEVGSHGEKYIAGYMNVRW